MTALGPGRGLTHAYDLSIMMHMRTTLILDDEPAGESP